MKNILKKIPIWCLILFSLAMGIREIYAVIPDKIYLHSDTDRISDKLDYGSMITFSDAIKVSGNGSYTLECRLLNTIPLKNVQVYEAKQEQIAVAGNPIGIYMKYEGVLVINLQSIVTQDGKEVTPAQNEIKKGDYIKNADGKKIESKEDLVSYMMRSDGSPIVIDLIREGKEMEVSVKPAHAADGTYKLGIWIRDDAQGLGTLTYIDEDGSFGALGHGITDLDAGELLKIESGELYAAKILSIKKGVEGIPGELSGAIVYKESTILGSIRQNTESGIFGTIDENNIEAFNTTWHEVGYKEDMYPGKAEIRCSTGDEISNYEIEIEEIYMNSDAINKNFIFKVTDSDLLKKTGGIVQGLSGSPIIQNGKLVGAVTHVLVNDPTRGYGIFIENMLDASE